MIAFPRLFTYPTYPTFLTSLTFPPLQMTYA
jgi:hypothetical protein